jgi:hypothetical protein
MRPLERSLILDTPFTMITKRIKFMILENANSVYMREAVSLSLPNPDYPDGSKPLLNP